MKKKKKKKIVDSFNEIDRIDRNVNLTKLNMELTDSFNLLLLEHSGGGSHHQPHRIKLKNVNENANTSAFMKQVKKLNEQIQRVDYVIDEQIGNYVEFKHIHGMSDEERDVLENVIQDAIKEIEKIMIGDMDVMRKLKYEDHNNMINWFQQSVVQLLYEKLKLIQDRFRSMKEIRRKHDFSKREKFRPIVIENALHKEERIIDEQSQNEYMQNLSTEEMQMLEQENRMLMDQLTNELEEAQRIERSAHEFSHLMDVFAEKVFEQDEMIEEIQTQAKENVDIVNQVPEQIIQASDHGKGFRHFMLIFLLISGLTLLLLDWMD
jgi:hypothetical protein